jgi:prepilin-type processing-associated H-X9-DG protein
MGRAVVAFLDGHVESKFPEELGYRILKDGKFVDLERVDDPPSNYFFSGVARDIPPPALPK